MSLMEELGKREEDLKGVIESWKAVKPLISELDTQPLESLCLIWYGSQELLILTDNPSIIGLVLKHGGVFKEKMFSTFQGIYTYIYNLGLVVIKVSNRDMEGCKVKRVVVDVPATKLVRFVAEGDCDPLLADEGRKAVESSND